MPMRHVRAAWMVALTVLSLTRVTASSTQELDSLLLIHDGQSVCTIVYPDIPDDWTLTAVTWLQDYLEKSTGARPTAMVEGEAPQGTLISVGHTKLAATAGVTADKLQWDGCRLVAKDNVLYLLGRDDDRPEFDAPHGPHGTARAVVTFLEAFCGIRWLTPTPPGDWIPLHTNVSVPADLDQTVTPDFAYSNGRFPYGLGTPASIANNFRNTLKIRTYGGHTWPSWVPGKVYFDEHPEYFALINGERTAAGGHLCTTNPEVRELLLAGIRKDLDEGYNWVQLGQPDGFRRCECEPCESLDNYRGDMSWKDKRYQRWFDQTFRENPVERVLLLHKWIAERCLESHPNQKVHMLIYFPTAWPSRKFESYGDNVIGEMCMSHPDEIIDAWRGKLGGMTGYLYWSCLALWHGMGVDATPHHMADRIRFYKENDFLGLYQTIETNWGLQGPAYYVNGKVMGDVDADDEALIDEYCQGLYGEAADEMRAFFDLLYAPFHDYKTTLSMIARWSQENIFIALYSPEYLVQLDELLIKAEAAADSERAEQWIRLTRDHFDFVKLTAEMFLSYRAYRANPNTEGLADLQSRVERFEDYRARIISYDRKYVDQWFPGWEIFARFLMSNGNRSLYNRPWTEWDETLDPYRYNGQGVGFTANRFTEPLNLDFEQLRKNLE